MEKRNSPSKGDVQNPWIPRGLYNILSRANRVSIWTIGLGCFVSIFTFWLGLSYQYTIVNDNRKEAQKAVHYNMLSYTTQHKEDCNSRIEDIIVYDIDMKVKELIKDTTYLDTYKEEVLDHNWHTLVLKLKEGIDISERAKYYFPEEQFRKITFNNLKIAEIINEYYSIIDTSKVNFYIDFNFLLLQNKGDTTFNKDLEDSLHYFRSNYYSNLSKKDHDIDVFKAWQFFENQKTRNQEFAKDYSKVMPELLECLSTNDSINPEKLSQLQEQYHIIISQTKKIDEITRKNLLILRRWILSEIVQFMSENYHIINDEVTPLDMPVKQNENEEKLIEPGYFLAVLSLIFIIPFGYCIWCLFVWIIFRNAEKPNKRSPDDWNSQEYLRSELAILSTIECLLLNSKEDNKGEQEETYSNMTLHRIEKDGKYGYADESGMVVIPCLWYYASTSFYEDLAVIGNSDGRYGFVDKSGKVIIPCQWKEALSFFNGLAAVKNDKDEWGYIDKANNVIIPFQWKSASIFSEGLAAVKDIEGKWGFIDKTGKIFIPCQWNYVYDLGFQNGVAKVRDSASKTWLIDKNGNVVGDLNGPFKNQK